MHIRPRRPAGESQLGPTQLGPAQRVGRLLIRLTGVRIIREATYSKHVGEGGWTSGFLFGINALRSARRERDN